MKTMKTRGVAGVDVLVSIVCMLIGVALVSATGARGERGYSKSLKDASQARGIHQSWIVFAREFNGVFPTPGLIDRLAHNGVETPGRGPEDQDVNTTACLHAAMIMNNYYSPELLISPVERNPKVKTDADYSYEMYDVTPPADRYWDPGFKADLTSESNVSYAHMPLFGERKKRHWRDTQDGKYATMGNRGPKEGLMDPSSTTCGPHGHWAGNVVFNDNACRLLVQTVDEKRTFINGHGEEMPDNFFAIDDGAAGVDMILSFTQKITKDGPELQWD